MDLLKEFKISPDPLYPNGFGGVIADNPTRTPYHNHDNINSPRLWPTPVEDTFLGVDNGKIQWLEVPSSPKTATFVIGPSSNSDSADYDYVTDGTDDDVQIQAAIDALPSTGGLIVFREGTYTLGAAVTIAKNGVSLQGMGKGTIITCKTNLNTSFFKLGHASTQYYNCVIQDFYFDGNQANQSAGTNYIIDNSTLTKKISNLEVLNNYFVNAHTAAINDAAVVGAIISGNHFINWKSNASSYALILLNSVVLGNYFETTSTSAPYLIYGASVNGNSFVFPTGYNARAIEGSSSFTNNYLGPSATNGTYGSSCVLVYGVNNCSGNHVLGGNGGSDVASIAFSTCYTVVGNWVQVIGVAFHNCVMVTGNFTGLMIGSTVTIDNKGNYLVSGNYISAGNSSGVLLKNVSVHCIVTGNQIAGSASAVYGIRENSSSDGPTVITNNVVIGTFSTAKISTQHVSSDVSHNITS